MPTGLRLPISAVPLHSPTLLLGNDLLQIRSPGVSFHALWDDTGIHLIDAGFVGARSCLARELKRHGWDHQPIRGILIPDLFPQEDELLETSMGADVLVCLEALAAHAFVRTQGPPVRSRHAGELRAEAWGALGDTADILRRPEFLAHALKVAADKRASTEERIAAVEFLPEYWGGDIPDEATAGLLQELKDSPPNRDLLVAVMQARIELGLDEELGALFAVEDWDDAQVEY